MKASELSELLIPPRGFRINETKDPFLKTLDFLEESSCTFRFYHIQSFSLISSNSTKPTLFKGLIGEIIDFLVYKKGGIR
ncbi:MAG: hypothetical protein DRN92_09740 [Thermoproteota archaeon]|nr:MAG: hypothetical protein DRN92_09740 [Candidatus Korarchaeota archaeon]